MRKTCAKCDGPISAAGRKSLSGIYYCSKIECKRERDRVRAGRWRASHAPPKLVSFPVITSDGTIRPRMVDRDLVELRQALLEGGLTQEEVDEQVPLPV